MAKSYHTLTMSPQQKSFTVPQLTKGRIFLAAAVGFLIFNLYSISQETFKTIKILQHRQRVPYVFLGDRFRGIENFVGQAPYIGYFTDKNLDDNRSARQFAQAQLVLAPSILDLNNTGHEFIIFDCTSPAVAMAKIQEIGAKPLKANPYGIILARNPSQTTLVPGDAVRTFDKTKFKQLP
jgi:hypothetical protein